MEIFRTLASVVNLRLLGTVLFLVALVFLAGWLMEKNKKARHKTPGMLLEYTVPEKTAADCKGLLLAPAEGDIFRYTLEPNGQGDWYFHLQEHRPTQQMLDTVFQLSFSGEAPAVFCLHFVREAFGQREPIVPEALLNTFFAEKLGAHRQGPTA